MNFYTNIQQVGNNILYRGVENGKRVKQQIPYKPTLFVKAAVASKSKYTNLDGDQLEPISFGSMNDAREFVKTNVGVDNYKIYGNTNYIYSFIADEFSDAVDFDIKQIVRSFIDIEVGSENGFPSVAKATEPVTAITILINDTYFAFGTGDFIPTTEHANVKYIKCKNEREMLEAFISLWVKFKPDIVSGWNSNYFDFPYLINRMMNLDMELYVKKLSPWGLVREREKTVNFNTVQFYDIVGVTLLDYMDLYKKYAPHPNQESYKLTDIAFVEIGERKKDTSEYENLHTLYVRDYQLFMEYNVHDVYLVWKLEEKLRLIELAMTLAYDNKVNYEDVFSQVRMWDSIINNYLMKKNIIIPPREERMKSERYTGAYVKDPIIGMHKWGVGYDLDGLYPHLIMQYNLSPETLVSLLHVPKEVDDWYNENLANISIDSILDHQLDFSLLYKHNLCMTPNGAFFTRDMKGFLPELMESMYSDRKRYKDQMIEYQKQREKVKTDSEKQELDKLISKFNNFQMAKKVTLNSAYGAIGNEYFRFFDVRIAEAVTTSGQLSVRWVGNSVNEHINKIMKTTDKDYIIASDTDSIYIKLGDIVDKTIDETKISHEKISIAMVNFCDSSIQPVIQKSFEKLATYMNAYMNKMNMKREAIFDRAVWTAKKRYILNVYNNEGVQYSKPKLKIKGLEAIKSSTPIVVRGKMKEAFEIIMKDDNAGLIDFIEQFKDVFKKLPVEEVSSPKGCNGITKYSVDDNSEWISGTPFHVKGALVYNRILREKKLTKKFQFVKNGEKIKYMYLKTNNPWQSKVISFTTSLPKELGVHDFLDYEEQFNKVFTDPLSIVTKAIRWDIERSNDSLERFFTGE